MRSSAHPALAFSGEPEHDRGALVPPPVAWAGSRATMDLARFVILELLITWVLVGGVDDVAPPPSNPLASKPPAPPKVEAPADAPSSSAPPEDAMVEACDGTRTEATEDARTLSCQRWKVEWREGGTVWGHVSGKSYDAVIAERERQLGFARQYARFFEEPFDERYADPSQAICDTCAPDKPVGRWGSGQKFGDSRARAAIEGAETDLGAFDKTMAEHLPRLKDVARLSREPGVDKAALEHAKQMRLGMLGLAKARLALDNAMVFRSEKAAKDVQRTIEERSKALAGSYADLLTAVGKEVGKAHGGKYLEDNTQGDNRPYLFVEFDGAKVTATYIVGAARSTWFSGEVELDGGITGRSLVAPENGTLTCAEHSEACGFVYVPAVLRFSERQDPDQKAHAAAELWFQQSKWVLAKPFSR